MALAGEHRKLPTYSSDMERVFYTSTFLPENRFVCPCLRMPRESLFVERIAFPARAAQVSNGGDCRSRGASPVARSEQVSAYAPDPQ
jgi:hypothetical protein